MRNLHEINSPWIRLDKSTIEKLTVDIQPREYPSKSMLLQRDQIDDYVHVVYSGRVLIFLDSCGGQDKTMMIAERGCLFGESSTIYGTPVAINAKAITPVKLFSIPGQIFKERVQADSEIAWAIIELYARKLKLLAAQVEMLSFDNPITRVKKMLYWLIKAHGIETEEGMQFAIKLTHQEIADLTGLSRVSVSYAFSELYEMGALMKTDGKLYICNIEHILDFSD